MAEMASNLRADLDLEDAFWIYRKNGTSLSAFPM
jgi:hypothetical protein